MAFLKVNCEEPVESIPVSSVFIFSHGCFKVVILSKLLICDYTVVSCVCFNSLSQTIVTIAILKHIVLQDYGLKENVYLRLNILLQILALSSYLGKPFHLKVDLIL